MSKLGWELKVNLYYQLYLFRRFVYLCYLLLSQRDLAMWRCFTSVTLKCVANKKQLLIHVTRARVQSVIPLLNIESI